jgi:hypothetical protein
MRLSRRRARRSETPELASVGANVCGYIPLQNSQLHGQQRNERLRFCG